MGRTGMLYDVVGSIKPIEVLPLGGKIGRDDRECQMHVELLNPEITKSNKVICKRYRAVSKVHAKIYYSSVKSSWVIEDADSKNGTYVNDKKLLIADVQEFKGGDRIKLGKLELFFEEKLNKEIDIEQDHTEGDCDIVFI
jgi:hypothetical protein